MPLLDIQPNAATRVYARSLFDLAMSQGGRGKVEEALDELQQIVEMAKSNPRFGDLLASPAIATSERAASLQRIFAGRVSPLTLQFLQVLNDKGRIAALTGIVDSLDEVAQEKFGTVEVDVYTAQPATPDMTGQLRDRLSQRLGKQVVVHNHTEPAMIGGVKIKVGDQLVDGSVATQLRRMKDKLTQEGGASLRAKIGRVLEG